MASNYGEGDIANSLKFLALAVSLVLCWIIFKVKMKKCEKTVASTASLLGPLQRAATAAATRQKVVKAATLMVEKTLREYKSLITMLHQTPESDFERDDFPPLRQQLEEENIKAQVRMVKECLAAASNELINASTGASIEPKSDKVLASLYEQGQLVMTISEEILSALDSRKRMLRDHIVQKRCGLRSFDD